MKFNVSGLDEILHAYGRMEDAFSLYEASPRTQRAVKEALSIIAEDARSRVHSVTGNLSSSIKVHPRIRPDKTILMEAGVSYAKTKAHHAHLVEYGHKVVAPGPKSMRLHAVDAAVKRVSMEDLHKKAARLNKKTGLKRPRNKGAALEFVPPYPFWGPAVEAKGDIALFRCDLAIADMMDEAFYR